MTSFNGFTRIVKDLSKTTSAQDSNLILEICKGLEFDSIEISYNKRPWGDGHKTHLAVYIDPPTQEFTAALQDLLIKFFEERARGND